MRAKCRNAYASSADLYIRVHDLAGFVVHLHFFLGITVVSEYVNLRNQVERQLISEFFYSDRFTGQYLTVLFVKFIHCGSSGSTGSLISGYVYALDV